MRENDNQMNEQFEALKTTILDALKGDDPNFDDSRFPIKLSDVREVAELVLRDKKTYAAAVGVLAVVMRLRPHLLMMFLESIGFDLVPLPRQATPSMPLAKLGEA